MQKYTVDRCSTSDDWGLFETKRSRINPVATFANTDHELAHHVATLLNEFEARDFSRSDCVLGEFGHHPEAVIDAEVEIGRLEGQLTEVRAKHQVLKAKELAA